VPQVLDSAAAGHSKRAYVAARIVILRRTGNSARAGDTSSARVAGATRALAVGRRPVERVTRLRRRLVTRRVVVVAARARADREEAGRHAADRSHWPAGQRIGYQVRFEREAERGRSEWSQGRFVTPRPV
jgi:hypothetical protein